MRIGIDFDNTIVRYDEVFADLACRSGLVDASFRGGKQALRDTLRAREGGEEAWQLLQGRVYGAGMTGARLIDGVDAFLRRCQSTGQRVFIISHKTEYGHGDPERINLRQAALAWMASQGFFSHTGFGLTRESVFFEATREEKLTRIAALHCDVFIDDLDEVLSAPTFPAGVRRILFAQTRNGDDADLVHCRTWAEIHEAVFHGRG
ncbi:MAG: hypothetical protein ACRDIC_08225 [bacterium]